jgi:hypothetical protein
MGRKTVLAVSITAIIVLFWPEQGRGQDGYFHVEDALFFSRETTAVALPFIETGYQPSWHSMITDLPGDWASVPTEVFQTRSLTAIGGIAMATVALIPADHQLQTATEEVIGRSPGLSSFSRHCVLAGDGRVHLGIAGAFAAYGFIADDSRALRTAAGTVEVLIAGGMMVQVLKRISGRESPEAATHSGGRWRPFPALGTYQHHQAKYYAFPSGHITTAMGTVTLIAENYPEVGWIRPVGYTVVGLLAISLVDVGYHWYSDFPLGIGLGYLMGTIVAHHHDNELTNTRETEFSVAPIVMAQGAGLSMRYSF